MNKIEIIHGHDGFEREVTGTYDLDGNNVYSGSCIHMMDLQVYVL
jgi:hypothetical protein